MGSMSRAALVLLLGTLLVVGFVPRSQAVPKADNVDLSDLDLSTEELEVMTPDKDGGEEFEGGLGSAVDEKDVVVLGAKDFGEFVKSNQFVLAEFYAPWCGHCQTLAPEFAKAATVLKEAGVALAKVDAVEHGDLAQEHGVESYPTLYFFVDGEKKPYGGGRTRDEIVNWVKKRIGPAVSIIKSAEEVLKSETPIAVAYLKSVEGADAEEFIAVARQEDGVDFHMTADAEIAKKFGLDKKTPSLVLLKKQNEKVATFDGSFERKALGDFVSENKLPLVIPFNRETASLIFESEITKQLLLFATPSEYEKLRADFEETAKSFKKKITFVLVDIADDDVSAPVLDFFALDNEKTRIVGFVAEQSGGKYLHDGDFSADSIKKFAEKFLAGDLTPYRKSEKAPEKNDGPVKIVVSSTFEEIVLDESKDVVIEVYAPWCGHCQSMEPEYNKLGEALQSIKSIVIAKMDGTKNEHERVRVEGYPTILLFPAGDKTAEPIPLDSERTAAGILKFLKTHAKVPFEAPHVSEPEPESQSDPEAQSHVESKLEEVAEVTNVKDEL